MIRSAVFCTLAILWIKSYVVLAQCPIASCSCDNSIIDCRSLNFLEIPTINSSFEIFDELLLQSNNIIRIRDDAFNGLKVKKIDFSGNHLNTISENAFRGLESVLTGLKLQGDDNVAFPLSSLTNLTNLVSLDISNFKQIQIISLPQNFENLEILILHTMQLNFISTTAVEGKLRNLKRLEITDNPDYTSFPTAIIRQLTKIVHVRFVQNGITKFPNTGLAFANNVDFTDLDLSSNSISELQNGCFESLQGKLTYLGLHLNYLDSGKLNPLKDAVWSRLETLVLDANDLSLGIPTDLFKNMPTLNYLNLAGSSLTQIKKDDFKGLTNLHTLHMSHNQIIDIEAGAFNHTPNLNDLDLSSIGRSDRPLNFTIQTAKGLEHLEILDLTDAKINLEHLWGSFAVMERLKKLTMTRIGSSVSFPHFTFQNNQRLELLDISETGLTSLTQSHIHGLENSLITLTLSGNSVTMIDECVIKTLSKLEKLYLLNNPLNCDCNLLALYDWAKQREQADPSFPYVIQAKCSSPASLLNKYLLDLSRNQLVCAAGVPSVSCVEFTTTTMTSTTTSTTTVTIPLPILSIRIGVRSQSSITVYWTAEIIDQLKEFLLTSEELGTGKTTPHTIDKTSRDFPLTLENAASDYRLCIKALTVDGRSTIPDCTISKTGVSSSPAPTQEPPSALTGGEIAGIAVGSGILILLVVAIVIFLLRYKTKPKKYKEPMAVHFTSTARPVVGYDSKRFTKQKPATRVNGGTKVNGDLIISTISSGKAGETSYPNGRHSAGSYQYLNENQMINTQPHLNYGKGANGTSHDMKPPNYQNTGKQREVTGYLKDPSVNKNSLEKSGYSRYAKTPLEGRLKQPPHYVNDPQRTPDSTYTNDIKDRPLPKPRTKHYENNNSAGFLNHGFDLDSPTHTNPSDNVYNEIDSEI